MPGLLQQPLHILQLDFGIREQIIIYPNMKNSVFGLAEVEVDDGQVRRSLLLFGAYAELHQLVVYSRHGFNIVERRVRERHSDQWRSAATDGRYSRALSLQHFRTLLSTHRSSSELRSRQRLGNIYGHRDCF